MKSKMMNLGLAFALGLAASVHASDGCSIRDTLLRGEAHLVTGNHTGAITGTSMGYQLWLAEGSVPNNSLTYYDNGFFKAEWQNTQDYWARVGLTYEATKGMPHNYKKLSLEYNYTKTVESGSVFIGVNGWTVDPAGEFFIIDDWIAQIDEAYVGRKFGEYEVDGSKYAVYALMTDEGESWRGYTHRVRFTSVRETPRECGYMDITAHFNKFDELFTGQTDTIPNARGIRKNSVLKFGNLTDLMATVEVFDNGKGSIDYAYIEFGSKPAETSSSSTGPESSSVAGSSSSATPESSSAVEPSSPLAMPQLARIGSSDRNLTVFDMQGRVLGQVFVPAGEAVRNAVFAKFGRPGVYMVKASGRFEMISVTK